MPIVVLLEFPGVSEAQYRQACADIAGHPEGLHRRADWPVRGLLSHTAAPTEQGWLVVDVWASQEAFEEFAELLAPILRKDGFPPAVARSYRTFNLVMS
ncbi:hypothetical protein [Kitasatospora sp. NBC_01539]|uniref:hypothetical protein n=1 Tax=Kitasatospora sp. NBC_01539 TaxID=2903577 RepID=UPI0038602BFF